jgi:hypothetical protein
VIRRFVRVFVYSEADSSRGNQPAVSCNLAFVADSVVGWLMEPTVNMLTCEYSVTKLKVSNGVILRH